MMAHVTANSYKAISETITLLSVLKICDPAILFPAVAKEIRYHTHVAATAYLPSPVPIINAVKFAQVQKLETLRYKRPMVTQQYQPEAYKPQELITIKKIKVRGT
jgi:hypothetical protein